MSSLHFPDFKLKPFLISLSFYNFASLFYNFSNFARTSSLPPHSSNRNKQGILFAGKSKNHLSKLFPSPLRWGIHYSSDGISSTRMICLVLYKFNHCSQQQRSTIHHFSNCFTFQSVFSDCSWSQSSQWEGKSEPTFVPVHPVITSWVNPAETLPTLISVHLRINFPWSFKCHG